MKKILISALMLSASLALSACTTDTSSTTSTAQSTATTETTEKMTIVATSFYDYDWVTQILGENQENFELNLLIDTGVDLHSYEPSVEDIAMISSADLFIYNGGESDTWVDDIIATNADLNAVSVAEILDDKVKMEVTVEGMEATEHDHDHDEEETEEDHDHDDEATEEDHDHDDEATEEDHDHDDEATEEEHDHEDEEAEADEHVWLSLENAIIVCNALALEIGDLDQANATTYTNNATNYIAQLSELATEYEDMISSAARDTVIFADRFPFLYLMSDYGINYYAAFQGCSAETEASFETIVFLAEKVNELEANYVFIIDNGLEELANTIISNSQNSDCQILTLNSMQSISMQQINDGANYLDIMKENLDVLTLALSE